MPDPKLRELERQWVSSGNEQDEADYLREKVRVGDLDRERLSLAAYLDHPAARLSLGDEAPTVPEDIREWVRCLNPWGIECSVRAGLSSAQSVISIWAEDFPDDLRPQQAIEAVKKWICNPCDQTANAARHAGAAAASAAAAARFAARSATGAAGAVAWAATAAAAAAAAGAAIADADATWAATAAAEADNRVAASSVHVRSAISNDLIPWALGYRDTVREQYDALQAQASQQTETP